MYIALIICIPVVAMITGYFTLKAYQMGLKHNYELKHDIKPTEPKSPIIEHIEQKEKSKQREEYTNIVDEWLNGKR